MKAQLRVWLESSEARLGLLPGEALAERLTTAQQKS